MSALFQVNIRFPRMNQNKALEFFAKKFEVDKKLFATGHVLLLAAELDKPDLRDKCLASLAENYQADNPANRPVATRYARLLEASFGSTPPKKPDRAFVKSVLDEADPLFGTEIAYVVGRTFELCGDRPAAEEYYREALALGQFQSHNCTLAGFRLHQEEKDPR